MRTGCPDSRHHKLPCNGCNAGPEVAELRRHQADDDIKNAIRCHGRKELSIDQLGDPLHRHPERIVDFAQRDIQHKKKRKDGQIALPCKLRVHLLGIIQEPACRKRQLNHQDVQNLYDPQHHIMLKFRHNFLPIFHS